MKGLKKVFMVAAMIMGVGFMMAPMVLAPAEVAAENSLTEDACKDGSGLDKTQKAALGCSEERNAGSVGVTLVNIVIGLVAVVAVAAIILGGIQYATSAGDAGKIATAKNTILYAVIGLVIALLAFAIVNFVVGETGLGG